MPSIEVIKYKLREATDAVSHISHDLMVRINDLEKSDCEFRSKVVDLHTEIQDLKVKLSAYEDRFTQDSKQISRRNLQIVEYVEEIDGLEYKLSERDALIATQRSILEDKKLHRSCEDRDRVISDINEVVKEWTVNVGQFRNSLHAIQKVSDLIDEWMNLDEVDEAPDDNSVTVRVAFLELS